MAGKARIADVMTAAFGPVSHRSCECVSLYAHEMDESYLCAEPFRTAGDVRVGYGRTLAAKIRENREAGIEGQHRSCGCQSHAVHVECDEGYPMATLAIEREYIEVMKLHAVQGAINFGTNYEPAFHRKHEGRWIPQ